MVRMIILALAYLVVLVISLWNPNILTKGIISELEVLIAVYLTIREAKKGFILAMVLTGISLILDILFFASINSLSTVSILMSTLFTVVVCSLIFYFSSNLRKRSVELEQQNVELCALYEEFAATEEELKEQNSKLLQYNDILQENERHINQLAYYDVLTELPNRTMVLNRIEFLIDMAQQKNAGFSIAMFDLDDFKVINDTMGHDFGEPEEMVNKRKLSQVKRMGEVYVQDKGLGCLCRVDVVAIVLENNGLIEKLEHYQAVY